MTPEISAPIDVGSGLDSRPTSRTRLPRFEQLDPLQPNALVRWAFYLSVFAIPFTRIYLPGTGDRIGVARLVQALILCAVVSQPRVCIRLAPIALLWFLAYSLMRISSGFWFTPGQFESWWPNTLIWLQYSLPWAWVMFNVLQFSNMARHGLWALVGGCSLCALFHLAGIGVADVGQGVHGRSAVFGENANVLGATYAITAIVLIGLGMRSGVALRQRFLVFALLTIVGAGLAKTGSRTAVLMLGMGILVLLFQGRSFGTRTKRVASVMLVGVVLATILWQIPGVLKRFEELDSANAQEQEGRVRMIPVLWDIFLRSPICGLGPDGYQVELTRRAMPHLIGQQRLISAHNLALMLLVETGVIGFLLFSAGIMAALKSAWRARFAPGGSLPMALILPLVIAALIVSNPAHHLVFWFAVAYALAGTA